MIPFNPHDPFPLLDLDQYSYQEAQEHAALVDHWLGFKLEEVEKEISKSHEGQQNWSHLSVQAFQTPYVELRNILEILKASSPSHVVDLGCAYGRMAFVIAEHYPQLNFTGYELEPLRVQETNRVLHQKYKESEAQIIAADLSLPDFTPPAADVYFIFDYGSEAAVKKTLNDLKLIALQKPIVVVGRGRLTRFLIHKEHPWLSEVNSPQHFAHFSIYSS
ncbi:class I SAM-dependent methyltransferase [Bdellovibrio reynosensis]|uniref:Class I SAM-dependent methyltransferase n=1 Tax=Bdellovibrio reynosensis TaxID=2835041 RepID=A0ABY4C974_9BACT|nr:class I SAM-dependent methyltransferase [Bdellovibrio reynosensis]UOF00043.1 class I SAM-dependent methyltransferase [Bdellovibrio reynosensis]